MNRPTATEVRGRPRMAERRKRAYGYFERFASLATRASGSSAGFILAAAVVVAWAVTGPLFGFSEGWQLVINTGTTIVTFLMVFLIQHSQNKDSRAVHLKLNELLASHEYASNRLVAIEDLDEESMHKLHDFYCRLAELAESEGGLKVSHSVDEAANVHSRKQRARQARPRGAAEAAGAQEAAHAAREASDAANDAAAAARDATDATRRANESARGSKTGVGRARTEKAQ